MEQGTSDEYDDKDDIEDDEIDDDNTQLSLSQLPETTDIIRWRWWWSKTTG